MAPPQPRVVQPLAFVAVVADEGAIAGDADTTELRALASPQPARTLRAHVEAEREPPARELTTGTILRSRYVIEQIIGRGGDSIVYRAADLQRPAPEERPRGPIAIKALLPEQRRNPNALARLKRAFQQMRSLSHPGIARVFDLDSDGDVPFMTMELVDGQPLNAWMKDLGLPQGVKLLRECCEALEHAHSLGIVHGDLKPSNVLVTHDGWVKLIDFGSAPGSGENIADGADLSLAATANYASPQVLEGKIAEVRDDVFSLACLSYVILSKGSHPFGRSSAPDATPARVYPESVPGIPERLSSVVMRGLATERDARTASARAFLDELIEANRIPLPPPAVPAPAPKPVNRPIARTGSIEVSPQPYQYAPSRTPSRPVLHAPASRALAEPGVGTHWRAKIYMALLGLVATIAVAAVLQQKTVQTKSASLTPPPNLPHVVSVRAFDPPAKVAPSVASAPAQSIPAPPRTETEQPAAVPAAAPKPRASGVITFDSSTINAAPGQLLVAIPVKRLQSTRGRGLVSWKIEGGNAQPGIDYEPVNARAIRFIEGQAVRSLYSPLVKRNSSAAARGSRTLVVSLQEAAGGSELGAVTRVTVTISPPPGS